MNKNTIPFDPGTPEDPSGLRLSSNAGTARGLGVLEFQQIGRWIGQVLDGLASGANDNSATERRVKAEVSALCRRYPIYPDASELAELDVLADRDLVGGHDGRKADFEAIGCASSASTDSIQVGPAAPPSTFVTCTRPARSPVATPSASSSPSRSMTSRPPAASPSKFRIVLAPSPIAR